MKIGPVEIRVHALVYLGLIFAVIITMLTLWRANSVGRLETFYRTSIMLALNEDEKNTSYLDEAAESCRLLIRTSPDKASTRLYLGAILLRANKPADALKEFNEIEKLPSATADEKVMAAISAGVAQFRQDAGDDPSRYAQAAAKCEPIFQHVIDKNPGNPDALANLALAKALQNPKSLDTLKPMADQALTSKTPPSLAALEQLHCLTAMILFNQEKPLESYNEYTRAQAVQPFITTLGDNQRRAMLAAIMKKDMPAPLRIKTIKDVDREQAKFGQKQIPMVLNALGYSRSLLKDEPDFVKAYYDGARYNFNQARTIDSKFSAAYRNFAALLEDRVAEIAKTLTASVTGINGETPQPNIWTNETKQALSIPDMQAINAIHTILREEEASWDVYNGQAAQTPEEKIDGRLRQISCLRRMSWTAPGESGATHAGKALTLAKELLTIGAKDPLVHFVCGEVMLDKGDKAGAFKELEIAKSLGMNTTASNRLLNALSGKAELVDVRPATGLRVFGSKALFRCTLRGIDMSNVKDFIMKLDGTQVDATRYGSQVLYVPQETQLGDGKHTVKISVGVNGAEAEEKKELETEFFVNKKPPTWTVVPGGPEMIATQPVWTITLEDVTGIDRTTLKVTMKKSGGGLQREMVRDGRYKFKSETGAVSSDVNTAAPFKVTPGMDVPPGDYTLDISVSNMAGIPLVESKKYNIK